MGVGLVTEQVMIACQSTGDRGDAVLSVYFIKGSISMASQARALSYKSECT